MSSRLFALCSTISQCQLRWLFCEVNFCPLGVKPRATLSPWKPIPKKTIGFLSLCLGPAINQDPLIEEHPAAKTKPRNYDLQLAVARRSQGVVGLMQAQTLLDGWVANQPVVIAIEAHHSPVQTHRLTPGPVAAVLPTASLLEILI